MSDYNNLSDPYDRDDYSDWMTADNHRRNQRRNQRGDAEDYSDNPFMGRAKSRKQARRYRNRRDESFGF
ncbi:hypothetical protein [Kordiimonas sediminis]|nr:hypothetical protein [Kordiimonas sediminis]